MPSQIGTREKRESVRARKRERLCDGLRSKSAESREQDCVRESERLARKFHGILKDESDQDFICRFVESARGFTLQQIIRIGDVAYSGLPGGLTALAAEFGRSLLDVVAVAKDFAAAEEDYR